MSFDDIQAEIGLLMSQLTDMPEDEHEVLMRLHTLINTLRAEGLPVPEDLKDLEAELDAKFSPPDDTAA